MDEHICIKEEFLGEVKEFIANSKGLKATMFTVAVAILIQVGTFLYLWGGLTTTVKMHDRDINEFRAKFNNVKIIGIAVAEDKGNNGLKKN